jgi:hypothetical protein
VKDFGLQIEGLLIVEESIFTINAFGLYSSQTLKG